MFTSPLRVTGFIHREISQDRVTGQVSEKVTLRKAVLHLPGALLNSKGVRSELGREHGSQALMGAKQRGK